MKCNYLRPEALKNEFQDKYKEIEKLLMNIVRPYNDNQKGEKIDNKDITPLLKKLTGMQTFTYFFCLTQGRMLLKQINKSGGGVAEETFNATIGTLCELEYQLKQLTSILLIQDAVKKHDPLLIELSIAYAEIRIKVSKLINMALSQMEAYDKFKHYDNDIKRWKQSINETMKQFFDETWDKAIGLNTQ